MELRLIESSINFATSILLLIESKNVKSNFSKVVFSSELTQNLTSRGWQHEFLLAILSTSTYSVYIIRELLTIGKVRVQEYSIYYWVKSV